LTAWVILGKDWQHDMFGVVFQFAFIIGLIFYAAFTLCLKPALLRMKENEESEVESGEARFLEAGDALVALPQHLSAQEQRSVRRFMGSLTLLLLFELFMSGVLIVSKTTFMKDLFDAVLGAGVQEWTEGLSDKEFCGQMISTFGALVLVALGTRWLRSPQLSPWLTWIVICFIYLQRTVLLPLLFHQFGGGVARFFVGFELFLIGLTASCAGLKGAAVLRELLRKYWILPLLVNAFLWGPAWATRFDENPPQQIPVILRVQLCELLWVLCFLCAGQDWFPASAWPDKLRGWLGNAALCLFLLHKAVHMLVPKPFSWLLLFVALPLPFWWRAQGPRCRHRSRSDPGAAKAPKTSRA